MSTSSADSPSCIHTDWLAHFLAARNMSLPDGRPLFAYKTSDEEFEQLQLLMVNAAKTPYFYLDKQKGFPAVWFLYAAEWWKRCYDGGAWSWSQLFDAIGMGEPPQQVKMDWVERACGRWKLSDSSAGGKRFLGRVVVNGGLPLRLIETAEGKISRLLKSVLRHVKSDLNVSSARISAEVDAQKNYLPNSYRQPLIIDLLAELVLAVLKLKDRYKLNLEEDPVVQLNRANEAWMDNMPLRLDGQSANRLLQGLVREAIDVTERHRDPFVLKRGIRLGTDGSTRLECIIEIASKIPYDLLAQLLGVADEQPLPSSFDLALRCESKIEPVGYALARDAQFLVTVRRNELPEQWFQSAIRLEVSRFGEVLHTVDLPDAASIDPEIPWVFEDAKPWGKLLRAGSCKVKAEHCLISVASGVTLECTGNQPVKIDETGERTLWRVSSGETMIRIGQDIYKISCNPLSTVDDSLHWSGQRLYVDSAPAMVFQGIPKLYRIDAEDKRQQIPREELYWQVASERICLGKKTLINGVGRMLWIKDGAVQTRLQMVCLPPNAKIEILPGNSITKGAVRLKSWPAHAVNVTTTEVELNSSRTGDDWQLELKSISATVPRQIDLDLSWTGIRQRLSIPFPGEGVRFVDAAGRTLKEGVRVGIDDLVGLRAHLLSTKSNARWGLSLSLQGSDSPLLIQNTLIYKNGLGASGILEVRLFELIARIKKMLASTTHLDAWVRIEFFSGHRQFASLQVARYRYWLEKDVSRGWVVLTSNDRLPEEDALASTEALALNLNYPDEPQLSLEQQDTDGVKFGAWVFDQQRRQAGIWMIYPAANAQCRFRPMIWDVKELFAIPQKNRVGLSAAMLISDFNERLDALTVAIADMVNDPGHGDWELAGKLLEKLGHLPLAAVDFFVALAKNPRAMVMAYLHLEGFSDRIADRVSQELPFEWILTSPEHWLDAMSRLKQHAFERDESRGMRMLVRDMEDKLERMRRTQPCLNFATTLALHQGLKIVDQSIAFAQNNSAMLVQIIFNKSFREENSLLQQMFHRAGDDNEMWPELMKKDLFQFLDSRDGQTLLCQAGIRIPREDYKICAAVFPLMVAKDVAIGASLDWLLTPEKLHSLRTYREFDALWFDDAYYAGMIWAISEKYIEI